MRIPNPEYIVRLINNFVGTAQIRELTDEHPEYENIWLLYPIIGRAVKEKLKLLNVETLGKIIEYSDWQVRIGKPYIERQQCMAAIANDIGIRKEPLSLHPLFPALPKGLCHGLFGRELLERVALVTILMIVVDMIQQEWYKKSRELEAEEINFNRLEPCRGNDEWSILAGK
jgi:hypothetical protein